MVSLSVVIKYIKLVNDILLEYKPRFTSAVVTSQYGDKEVLQYAIPLVLEKNQPSKVTQRIPFPEMLEYALKKLY